MSEQPVPPVTDNAAYPEIDPVERRKSRIKLLLIIAIFGIPLLLASVYLHMVRSSGGQLGDTSRGQLIQPAVPLTEFSLQQADEPFNLDTVRGSWTLLYMPDGECADTCELNLYHMRQVRLALNHRMDRVQRAVLLQSEGQVSDELLAEHPGLMAAAELAAIPIPNKPKTVSCNGSHNGTAKAIPTKAVNTNSKTTLGLVISR